MNPSAQALKRNHEIAMDFVSKVIDGMNFGSLQFEIKKHKGLVGQIIVHGHRSVAFRSTDEAVASLGDHMVERLTALAKEAFTGTVSPAVIYKEGEITRLILDEYHEIDLLKLQRGNGYGRNAA